MPVRGWQDMPYHFRRRTGETSARSRRALRKGRDFLPREAGGRTAVARRSRASSRRGGRRGRRRAEPSPQKRLDPCSRVVADGDRRAEPHSSGAGRAVRRLAHRRRHPERSGGDPCKACAGRHGFRKALCLAGNDHPSRFEDAEKDGSGLMHEHPFRRWPSSVAPSFPAWYGCHRQGSKRRALRRERPRPV